MPARGDPRHGLFMPKPETLPRPPNVVLRICSTCHEAATAKNIEVVTSALETAGFGDIVAVRTQACLNACAEPVAVALQGSGRATYVFAGLTFPSDAADLIATVRRYLDSPAGWIEDARACGRLRHCLRARITALDTD